MSESLEAGTAPMYSVPLVRIVSIEHPCTVRDLENGLKSLGGEPQMKHAIEHRVGEGICKPGDRQSKYPEPVLGVSLRPHDPLAKKLASAAVDTRNVLVKVTLPKWTGRKRKRGSDDSFTTPETSQPHSVGIDASQLLRRLRDNEGRYSIEPVGLVTETHRFRAQPDFQMHTADLPIMQNLCNNILTGKYEDMQNFHINLQPEVLRNVPIPLPPTFTAVPQPYRYQYQQAGSVIYTFDESGNQTSYNVHPPPKRVAEALAPDAPTVPDGPPPNLIIRGVRVEKVEQATIDLRKRLEERPVITKRVLHNDFPQYQESAIKEGMQRAGYSFSAGPFRDMLIKFGVDPRKDPKYRFYQMIMFSMDRSVMRAHSRRPHPGGREQSSSSAAPKPDQPLYLFDGITWPCQDNGKMWQLCDIVDPLLQRLIQEAPHTEKCDVHLSGWYHGGTLAKLRTIMRDKMMCIHHGEPQPEAEYRMIAELPDELTQENIGEARAAGETGGKKGVRGRDVSARAFELLKEYRTIAKWGLNMEKRRRRGKAALGNGSLAASDGELGEDGVGGAGDGADDEEFPEEGDEPNDDPDEELDDPTGNVDEDMSADEGGL